MRQCMPSRVNQPQGHAKVVCHRKITGLKLVASGDNAVLSGWHCEAISLNIIKITFILHAPSASGTVASRGREIARNRKTMIT